MMATLTVDEDGEKSLKFKSDLKIFRVSEKNLLADKTPKTEVIANWTTSYWVCTDSVWVMAGR
jgi:hypothetical protein